MRAGKVEEGWGVKTSRAGQLMELIRHRPTTIMRRINPLTQSILNHCRPFINVQSWQLHHNTLRY